MTIRAISIGLMFLALLSVQNGVHAADKVLRVVPHADLNVLDPPVSTAVITLMHGLMIYDTLFSWDAKLQPKPQMVETYQISPDRLVYTFTLRAGLKFHDGQPVTTGDVIPSLKRWMVRSTLGQMLATYVEAMEATDEETFVIRLKQPFAFVEMALGTSNAVIMRARDAATDPYKSVSETIGSGPFRFVRSEWNPGAKVVYEKNSDYVPRLEAADGLAGGKVVKLDRVEWIVLPDPFTKSSAIKRGEVDMIDQLPQDQITILDQAPGVVLGRVPPVDSFGIIRPNHLHPPFNHPKARQALAFTVDQREYASAAFGDKRWWRECWSFFVCGNVNGTEAGSESYHQQDLAHAKELLAEADYKGEKIILISTSEIPKIGALADITADNLRKIGANVDLLVSDWGTMQARLAKKDPPGQGGWNLFTTTFAGYVLVSPLSNNPVNSGCGGDNWFGWPCDAKTEELRGNYIRSADETARGAELAALHRYLWQALPMIPVGQFAQPYAWRSNVTGVLRAHLLVFWNIDKD